MIVTAAATIMVIRMNALIKVVILYRVKTTKTDIMIKMIAKDTTHLSASTMILNLVLMNMRRSKILTLKTAMAVMRALRTQDSVDACQPKELSVT